MPDVILLVLLVLFGSIFALVGGILFLTIPSWSVALGRYSVPFAGGVLLTVSLISILPESTELLGQSAYVVTLITFLTIYLFEQVFFSLHHHDDEDGEQHHHQKKRAAWLVMVGDTIHNAIDGIAIAAAFAVTPGLGAVTAVSTFLHEVPHEIGDFGVLLRAKWSKRAIIATNVISACASLVGALCIYQLRPSDWVLGFLLAVSAGIFLYLGASDFLPHAGKNLSKPRMVVALLLGVGLMLISAWLIPHN